jgi:Immunoglobulin-like domain of bacterial spore germination
MKTNRTLILIVLLAVIVIGSGLYLLMRPQVAVTPPAAVLSFQACVEAGYPVTEGTPRQCVTPDGRTYVQEPTLEDLAKKITYKNATINDIVVTNPTPGAVTGKTFTVTGKARGPWYFEASFPVRVLDGNGNVLATGVAKAQGDWMTTEFVPFTVSITVPGAYIGPATLVLQKDNPSGLPEKDASISFPFTIQ